jgi:hypothetical protein
VPSVTGSRNGLKEPVSDYAMAGFGLTIAHTPLFRSVALRVVFNCKAVVKSFKQFRALPNRFVLNRLCGCSASRARLGTEAHFGDGCVAPCLSLSVGPGLVPFL